MRGLWLEAQTLRLRDDLPRPEPAAGEARVRVLVAGICNTDLELVRGYYPFTGIPGHEFVGRVETAAGAEPWVGRRVVGEINASCGTCGACRAGRPTHCEQRTVLGIRGRDGAFAEGLTLPIANLHAVPAGISDETAVFAEPLAAALEIQEQVAIGPRDRVVVIGDGKLGHLVAQTLALTGCALTVIGRHPAKLALLAARGITTGLADDIPRAQADVVVECTGNAEGLDLARAAVRPRGTIVLKSTYRGPASLDISRIVVDEITLVGSRCGPFAPALALLADGRVDVRPLVHARFPLHEAVAAFAEAARPGVMKVLLEVA
ncbi:MAG TPA: alcohol dehydrogenase catalytic domain-containing protein [Vicinamibacteria bacterium]|nr:alcohol dehydrogenase catalytic domain-containing protein [Vicinamibacteria bacterium]